MLTATARTGENSSKAYDQLTRELGKPYYERIDVPAKAAEKKQLTALSPDEIGMTDLAGEFVLATLTTAPGDGASIGGIKVVTENGWFAARPSVTEDVYKIYAESFKSAAHLCQIQQQAENAIAQVLKSTGEKVHDGAPFATANRHQAAVSGTDGSYGR